MTSAPRLSEPTLRQRQDMGFSPPAVDLFDDLGRSAMPKGKGGEGRDVFFDVRLPISICPTNDSLDVVEIVAVDVIPSVRANKLSHALPQLFVSNAPIIASIGATPVYSMHGTREYGHGQSDPRIIGATRNYRASAARNAPSAGVCA